MFIVFTLASLVLVLGRRMRVEGIASANLSAAVQAASIERGAEAYVLALLTEQKDTLPDLTEDYFSGVQVGDGYFWLLRPDFGDDNVSLYGLTEEAAKLNINVANYDMLMKLPNMTDDVANAILDWKDSDSTVTSSGAETEYYMNLPTPYMCKNAPFETVEELLMVRGVTQQLLYGDGTAPPLGVSSNVRSTGGQVASDLATARGWYDLLTIYSNEPNSTGGGTGGGQQQKININDGSQRQQLQQMLEQQLESKAKADSVIAAMGGGRGGQQYQDVFDFYMRMKKAGTLTAEDFDKIYPSITTQQATGTGAGGTGSGSGSGTGSGTGAATGTKGRINVNTAPRDVLLTLPNLESADVDNLLAARAGQTTASGSVAWVADALEEKSIGLEKLITAHTYQYSADILAVSANGRAFKRCRIVVNTSGSTPQIIYRRDLTDRGWPMPPEILDSLRAGQGLGAWATGGRASTPGGMNR
jgi:type II secretory pathway component PulK